MKKWLLIIVLLVIVVSGIFTKIYLTAVSPVKSAEKKAIAIAQKSVPLSEVDKFHLYHGVETVYVIEGKNKQGVKIIIWIPEKSKKMIVKRASSGITEAEAINKLRELKQPKKIVSVRLGMEKDIPFWEIYYLSDHNLINYYYVDFSTGQWLEKIENL